MKFAPAAQAFRRFFEELREAFFEREALFTQIELALLSKEHVLVTGPPGTAKSAVASAVLGRLVDEKTGAPSLFSRQLAESTVQSDLIGPVDFKILTETGRTEYITDDGMLGATHAFLDEVFDGRDMLLRSILNVLHERELKHGKKVTAGRCECAIMTSNRYLSEVLARSPELLLAFADRLSYICFCPKAFARPASRAAMLSRAVKGQRPELRASLSLQQLDVLQEAVEKVHVPSSLTEGLELLSELLERQLYAQVAKLPDYVPTKYFSQRSLVKALWALKAAVVRDCIWRRPERPFEAGPEDLEALRYFFLLGGPSPEETEALLKGAADPRERAQLEIIRVEQRAFAEVLAKVKGELGLGPERELKALSVTDDVAAVESIARGFQAPMALSAAQALREKLLPGPRHPENRRPLVAAARTLVLATEDRLGKGMAGQGEGRGGVALLTALAEVHELCRLVPELHDRLGPLTGALAGFAEQALEMTALFAQGTELDEAVKLDGLAGLARSLAEEIGKISELASRLVAQAPETVETLREKQQQVRRRVAASLRRRALSAFQSSAGKGGDPFESLSAQSRRLGELESALVALSADQAGLRQELLAPLGHAHALEVLGAASFTRVEQYTRLVQSLAESLRREGVAPEPILDECKEVIDRRLRAHARSLPQPVKVSSPSEGQVQSGEAYMVYRNFLGSLTAAGELHGLAGLEAVLSSGRSPVVPDEIRRSIAVAEMAGIQARIQFLRSWLSQLLSALPSLDGLSTRAEAERAFDKLVKSRFPMLATKEGELLRLQSAVALLATQPGEVGDTAKKLDSALRGVAEDFAVFSKRLLEARAALSA
ncbi:MAG: AAA family ATPase [Myxococcota bacterium]